MKTILMAGILACSICLSAGIQAGPTFDYQGRVLVMGSPYTGAGYFKFSLVDGSGQILWHHDGSSGSEPGSAMNLTVNNGLFSVRLGADGMAALPALALHRYDVQVRTWFSTTNSGHQQLTPDVFLHPPTFGHLDTAETIVLDPQGKGDFPTIQDAVDYVGTGTYVSASILLLPGYYQLDNPVRFPTTRNVSLVGLGDPNGVILANTNGPAVVPVGQGRLENLSLNGTPALDDEVTSSSYRLEMHNCRVQRRDGDSGPAVRLGGEGRVIADGCVFTAEGAGRTAVELFDQARLDARNCQFYTYNGGGAGIVISNLVGEAEFSSCELEGDTGPGLMLSRISGSVELRESRVERLVLEQGHGWVGLRNCTLWGESPHAALQVVNWGSGSVLAEGCRLNTSGAPTVDLEDATHVRLLGCQVNAWEQSGIKVEVTGGSTIYARLEIEDTSIYSNASAMNGHPAVAVTGDAGNTERLSVDLEHSRIYGNSGDGVRIQHADLDATFSEIEASGAGIRAEDMEVVLAHSAVEGELGAVRASGGMVELISSHLFGEETALSASNSFVLLEHTDLSAEEGTEALRQYGGSLIGLHSFLSSMGGSAVGLYGSIPVALLDHCTLAGVGTNATPPVVQLDGNHASDQPELVVLNGSLRGFGSQKTIDTVGPHGCTVRMANTTLSAPVNVLRVTLTGADQDLGSGNMIIASPPAFGGIGGGD